MVNIERNTISMEKTEIEIENLKKEIEACNGDPATIRLKEGDIRLKELDLYEINLARLGAIREAETLLKLATYIEEQSGEMTYERMQLAEEQYWRVRLEEQATEELMAYGRVGAGNLQAIRQLQRNVGKKTDPVLEDKFFADLVDITNKLLPAESTKTE
jgi:hypothetical protein